MAYRKVLTLLDPAAKREKRRILFSTFARNVKQAAQLGCTLPCQQAHGAHPELGVTPLRLYDRASPISPVSQATGIRRRCESLAAREPVLLSVYCKARSLPDNRIPLTAFAALSRGGCGY